MMNVFPCKLSMNNMFFCFSSPIFGWWNSVSSLHLVKDLNFLTMSEKMLSCYREVDLVTIILLSIADAYPNGLP